MRSMTGQKGVSDTTLLLGFVLLFIFAIIALPKYLKWRETAKLPAEVRHLRRLYAAEHKYRSQISLDNKFAGFKQLAETGLLPACENCAETVLVIDGLRFDLNRNYEETLYCIRVTGTKTYAMNSDGKIFEGTVACAEGQVTGSNLQEFK